MSIGSRKATSIVVTLLLSGALLAGCSSSPSEEELRQLQEMKDQATALQRELTSLEQQKSGLDKDIADKNAKLKKCGDDQVVVKQRLAK
jgi:septal ring factor EnvC (AmiA/AmiB activator)